MLGQQGSESTIVIRDYTEADSAALWEVFFHTVRNVNVRDYSQIQVEAWAPTDFDPVLWKSRMDRITPYVAEINGVAVGYADLQLDGMIDHFFCHFEYQGKSVGKALMSYIVAEAEKKGIVRLFSEVSHTARPFYEHFGFAVVEQQSIEVRGQALTNFIMERRLGKTNGE
ncbi:GNAT family N-acetyltransferase [Vibrio makurazakiensis]|uniref:GNAT family N-acetyltransferase n=1 Tax=Vibrio makurazakiensis TaxID=2910250 RepID=UPI003D0B7C21